MQSLSLDQASRIIEAAIAARRASDMKPVTVAVLDAGGHLLAFQREDGSSIMRPQIAIGKAAGALALGVSSRKIADMAAERPAFISAVAELAPQGLVPAAGGVLIVDVNYRIVGAVGITGDTSDNDERCALAGIAATGLRAQA